MRFPVFLIILSLCVNLNATVTFTGLPLIQGHHASENTTDLLKVDMVYYKDFPYKKSYANQRFKNCIVFSEAGVVRCRQQVALLRPAKIVEGWLHTQNKKGYLPFALKKYGIMDVKAYITEIVPAESIHNNKNSSTLQSSYVPATGIFIRHVLDVSQYTFKNQEKNITFFIKATPDHPVYAVNRQAFISISQLSPEDTLLSAKGEKIKLVCPDKVKGGCGTVFNRGKITSVYNIETSQRHTYFVQSENMLVHNCGGEAAVEKQPDITDTILNEEIPYKKSVALIVKDTEGNPVVDDDNRYMLETIIRLSKSDSDARFKSFYTRRPILGISDHAGYVADYGKASSLRLNKDGRLMVSRWFQKKKLVMDTAETARYSDAASDPQTDVMFPGSFFGAIVMGVSVLTGLGIYELVDYLKKDKKQKVSS